MLGWLSLNSAIMDSSPDSSTASWYIGVFAHSYSLEYRLLSCFTVNNFYSTHTPVKWPFVQDTWVSRYRKGKTNLDFTEARDSEWQWHQLCYMQVCTSLLTDNHASTPPLLVPFLPPNRQCQVIRKTIQSCKNSRSMVERGTSIGGKKSGKYSCVKFSFFCRDRQKAENYGAKTRRNFGSPKRG